jgi:FkbM family methyltransferase
MKPLRLSLAQRLCRPLPPIVARRIRLLLYSQQCAYRDDYHFTVKSQTGSLFSHTTNEFHAYPFSVYGYYDWRNLAVAAAVCQSGDTLIEVGANIGTETIGYADIVGGSGRVYAFEPLPTNLLALEKLKEINQFTQLQLSSYALSDRHETASFQLPPTPQVSGVGFLTKTERANVIEVECIPLDCLLEKIESPVKAIFVDTEGAEPLVLKGGCEFILHHQPVVVLEASPILLQRASTTIHHLYRQVLDLDYTPYRITRLNVENVDVSTMEKNSENWVCLPVHGSEKLLKRIQKHMLLCGILPFIGKLNPLSRVKRSLRQVATTPLPAVQR